MHRFIMETIAQIIQIAPKQHKWSKNILRCAHNPKIAQMAHNGTKLPKYNPNFTTGPKIAQIAKNYKNSPNISKIVHDVNHPQIAHVIE